MCLAVPGQIISITGDNAVTRTGKIQFGPIIREASLAFLPDAKAGDYVLVHAGVAITKVHEDEAQRIFGYLEEIDEIHG